ncbi:class III signal peptide-containing protein [Methanococcus maripaludis]|uniref:Class III signal peptide n=1 Tax=Methanococcus maripaludis TaxID=39152 RepID=A0A7J9PUW8_METMI|nr:class III signal peptide-containing protein [Methanococcus maripaludis]MBA2869609.1 hypothetical protein [Methanococcus maripaludis]
MLLNSKRGQLSIEMVILILAVLLSGTIFATHMTKNAGSHDEISGFKEASFKGTMTSLVTTSQLIGNFDEMNIPEEVSDENTETPIIYEGIVPGNGKNIEFEINCKNSNEDTTYFLNNGGQGNGKSGILSSSVGNGFVGRFMFTGDELLIGEGKEVPIAYIGNATYIHFKPKGGDPVTTYVAKDPENPIIFMIVHKKNGNGNGNQYGKYSLAILTPSRAEITQTESNGNGNGNK